VTGPPWNFLDEKQPGDANISSLQNWCQIVCIPVLNGMGQLHRWPLLFCNWYAGEFDFNYLITTSYHESIKCRLSTPRNHLTPGLERGSTVQEITKWFCKIWIFVGVSTLRVQTSYSLFIGPGDCGRGGGGGSSLRAYFRRMCVASWRYLIPGSFTWRGAGGRLSPHFTMHNRAGPAGLCH
jgi:hypothetical protein